MARSAKTEKNPQGEALWATWKSRIEDALKREKQYRRTGRKVVDLYEAKNSEKTPYAILYSNTELMVPAIYNSTPIPVVTRRFRDADPIGKAVSEVSTRLLKYLIEDENEKYDSFDDLMGPAVLEAALVNRGLTRFKYSGATNSLSESVCGESVRWDKFFHGYARTWKKVPWVGFEWDMTKEEIQKNFPDAQLDLTAANSMEVEEEEGSSETREEMTGVHLYPVYEIWDKSSRKVMFFSYCCPSGPLKVVEDPLGLTNFFPVPKPINFMRKVSTLVPTPLYEQYRQQALELNEITRRLKAIIKAIRFRGAYNSTVEGIENMLNAEDNELVPIENMASMPENTTIDKLLWTVPTNELATTAQSLYQQREQCKAVIFEITGLSDILRGSSRASETAKAQEIKNQWGSLRLKKMQKEVQRYVRESLVIILEIAASSFEVTTIKQMTGLPYLMEGEKAQIQQQMQAAQAAAQMSGQQPPPVPPELQEALAAPTWEQIVGVLKNDIVRKFKTDIETNSTIDAEAAQDKEDISELMNAMSQLFMALTPLVEKGFMPFDIAKDILLIISRRYNFGPQLEDSLLKMAAPPPPQDDGAAQAEMQAKQMELQAKQQDNQFKMQLAQQDFEHKQQLMKLEQETAILNARIAQQEAQMREKAVQMKMAQQTMAHNQKMAQLAATPKKEPANASV